MFGNCPKYIAARTPDGDLVGRPGPAARTSAMSSSDRRLIRAADTAFLGTTDATGHADASHRGGLPGFMVVDGATITIPD